MDLPPERSPWPATDRCRDPCAHPPARPGEPPLGGACGSKASFSSSGSAWQRPRSGACSGPRASVLPRAAAAQPRPQSLRTQAHGIIACDFFSVETAWLRRLSVLVFIELGSRWIHLSASTAHPDSAGVT